MNKTIICPVYDYYCPYCSPFGYCQLLEEEGIEPYNDCSAFCEWEGDEE